MQTWLLCSLLISLPSLFSVLWAVTKLWKVQNNVSHHTPTADLYLTLLWSPGRRECPGGSHLGDCTVITHSLVNCVAPLIMLGWQEESPLISKENYNNFLFLNLAY